LQIAFATKPFRPERSLPQAAPEWRLLVLDPLAPASCTSTGTYNQRASWQVRPDLCTTLAAGGADEVRLDVRQPDMIGPAVSVGFDVMAAAVIAAIDQHIADAGFAHLAEGDLLRVGRHDRDRSRLEVPTVALLDRHIPRPLGISHLDVVNRPTFRPPASWIVV
jgi:hypothetical protein